MWGFDDYKADFISPFNSNDSLMWDRPIDPRSVHLTDKNTLYEMDVFQQIRTSDTFLKRNFAR